MPKHCIWKKRVKPENDPFPSSASSNKKKKEKPEIDADTERLLEMIVKISQDPKTAEEAERFHRRISTMTAEELFRVLS